MSLEAIKAHQAKLSRWKNDACVALGDTLFVPAIMQIVHRAREPLDKWFNWMKTGDEEKYFGWGAARMWQARSNDMVEGLCWEVLKFHQCFVSSSLARREQGRGFERFRVSEVGLR